MMYYSRHAREKPAMWRIIQPINGIRQFDFSKVSPPLIKHGPAVGVLQGIEDQARRLVGVMVVHAPKTHINRCLPSLDEFF